MIQRWKPWRQSTGPKSAKGKAVVSQNAYTGGDWKNLREISKVVHQALMDQNQYLAQITERDI